ncbi:EF-hand domain-containing protein [Arsenicitalea aurantiaca]|uniref:EF-hand domain-containing protein n=1 Tax=Arsenicitalea aurantiaca TaxID=1783274 RepID=A0A433XLX8_9HYPH|nr:EF-hand domain-containing protein [Arsenicitalea aurantiaca]RUT35014.1 EF-hand domain-containing protein [Arsenicitalea aurantiaca]
MKKLLVTIAAIGFSTAAMAQAGTDFAAVDTDMSGDVSFEEALVAWPELTPEAFTAADLDQNGVLSPEEYATLAGAAGL